VDVVTEELPSVPIVCCTYPDDPSLDFMVTRDELNPSLEVTEVPLSVMVLPWLSVPVALPSEVVTFWPVLLSVTTVLVMVWDAVDEEFVTVVVPPRVSVDVVCVCEDPSLFCLLTLEVWFVVWPEASF